MTWRTAIAINNGAGVELESDGNSKISRDKCIAIFSWFVYLLSIMYASRVFVDNLLISSIVIADADNNYDYYCESIYNKLAFFSLCVFLFFLVNDSSLHMRIVTQENRISKF